MDLKFLVIALKEPPTTMSLVCAVADCDAASNADGCDVGDEDGGAGID